MRENNISDQVPPLILCFIIIYFKISLIVHYCIVIGWLEEGNKMLEDTIIIAIGIPINVGVMKETNRFSFICFLKVTFVVYFLRRFFGALC